MRPENTLVNRRSHVWNTEAITMLAFKQLLDPAEGPWITLLMQGKYAYYYNVETGDETCAPSEEIALKTSWLTDEEIQVGCLMFEKWHWIVRSGFVL